jgi:hypothetical protein
MKITQNSLRVSLIILVALLSFAFFFTKPVIVQDPSYHNFIDSRSFLGIPNALDVLSNIFFLLVGILGVKEITSYKLLETKRSWFWFFLSIILVAPGSAYYHWSPNNATLVWDRLPMSMGFMALYIILLSEHYSLKFERFLPFALFIGLFSVLTWVITSDLRFYFWIQFSSFVTIPIILLLFPSLYTKKSYYLIALVIYGAAKWAEVKDQKIFQATNEAFSGHTLKHVLAALGLAVLWWMVKTRERSPIAVRSGSIADSSPEFEETSEL